MVKFTRQQYMDNECTHEQYYRQFVTAAMKREVANTFGVDRILRAMDQDAKKGNLNAIPLAEWDRVGLRFRAVLHAPMREAGDGISLAGLVCVMKQAARMLVEKSKP